METAMKFSLKLRCPLDLAETKPIDEPGADLVTIVMDGCALLAEAGCRFIVSGFGDASWPVDVQYDLSIVLQQLTDVLGDLGASRATTLGFYGQGAERIVDISAMGGQVTLACRSGTKWQPGFLKNGRHQSSSRGVEQR